MMMIQQYLSLSRVRSGHARFRTYIVTGKEELRRGLGVLEKRWENLERCLADFGSGGWGEIMVRLNSVKCQMQR